jgi:hypothetical protein
MTRHLLATTTGALLLLTLIAAGCGGGKPEAGCPLPAPHDLKLVSIKGSAVEIAWGAGAGAPTSYILEAGSAPGKSDQSRTDLHGAATTYTATGVKPGTYYARVFGVSACGTSPASNEIVAVVP